MEIPQTYWGGGNDQRFGLPDWEKIGRLIDPKCSDEARHHAWEVIARHWMQHTAGQLGGGYAVDSSPNFLLVSRAEEKKAAEMLGFLEASLAAIRKAMPFLDRSRLHGICPVVVIEDDRVFYEYLAGYTGVDGEYASVGGVYLNRGYGHFVMPGADLRHYRATFAHELSHALLNPLALPLWLDEAITATVENDLAGGKPYVLDRDLVRRHHQYWDEEGIQAFWRGESFWFPDEGQELSYHLARFVFHALLGIGDGPQLTEFVLKARREDAGEAAAQEVFGFGLGEIIGDFLGPGDWVPRKDLPPRDPAGT